MNNTKIFIAALISAAFIPTMASAASYDFADLKWSGSPAKSSGFLPSETLQKASTASTTSGLGYWNCTGGDVCSSNMDKANTALGGDLKFTSSGLTVTATALFNGATATVVQDHDNGYNASKSIGAGLGVYHLKGNNSDDNITAKETLVMSFANAVALQGFSLRSDGHNTTWNSNSTFTLAVTGADNVVKTFSSLALKGAYSLSDLTVLNHNQPLVGSKFAFSYGGTKADQFYLSGMTASAIAAVPEPATSALLMAGLGAIGFVARRRRAA